MLWEKSKQAWQQNLMPAWLLYFSIALAPFPFGSTSNIAISFWCIVLGVAACLVSTQSLRREQVWVIAGLLVIVAGYVFVLHEQMAEKPWIAPPHPIWDTASAILGVPLAKSASIVRNEPFFAVGGPLTNVLSFFLGLVIGIERFRSRRILLVIAIAGAAYALYGVLTFVIDPTTILWREKRHYLGNLTSTFINRNTAAIYFGSCSLIWLLILLEKVRRNYPARRVVWRKLLESGLATVTRDIWSAAGLLICLIAMFLTGSRAGAVLSLGAMIVTFTVFFRRDLSRKSGIWLSLGLGAIVALGLLVVLGGRVNSRFDSQGLVDEGRIEAWRSTLRMIGDFPWFGTGMGTFTWAFPFYRSSSISMRGFWDAAHSTPLELASEAGLPLAILVAVGWGIVFWLLIRGVRIRRRDAIIPLAALATGFLSILHSTIDFTVQVPGYTIPFFSILGAGLSQAFRLRSNP